MDFWTQMGYFEIVVALKNTFGIYACRLQFLFAKLSLAKTPAYLQLGLAEVVL